MQSTDYPLDPYSSFPKWACEAVVYQIFPDRFHRSNKVRDHDHLTLKEWGDKPTFHGFHGGDLYGVIDKLDYLENIGINCIYLNPIFSSAANHRYHTYDYFQVDPLLGGNKALRILIRELHDRGLRIILDGVFNHCGRGFWAFHHLLENGINSPYKEWFCINNWPLRPYIKNGKNPGYSCWWNDPALPKFNHEHIPVRNYLLEVASFWTNLGIDGWRLDVPDEVPSDFWILFRKEVKSINSDAMIIGEIWGDAREWLKGDQFDGVLNYRIGWSSLSWVANDNLKSTYKNPFYPLKIINTKSFIEIIQTTLGWYRKEANICNWNLLDSHDVPRALNTLKGDIEALKLALLLVFMQPGIPCIYYGTEVGLFGGIDPNCREGFPWDENWDCDLRPFLKSLILLREDISKTIVRGLTWHAISENGLLGCSVKNQDVSPTLNCQIFILINRSRQSWLELHDSSIETLFELGQIELSKRGLGPQSAVVYKKNL